ncbi:MAG: TetR/AcrR family transcriptional regulator [Burkholderiales bacterium]|nr:TetR/AcrR family transcriptional regulator [Burkholderiales bacterium]
MDRRQQKTRAAIFEAFGKLLAEEGYNKITVQDIIDAANIGRSTFYGHFDTKADLLREMNKELFDHIFESAMDHSHKHGLYSKSTAPNSVFCHLLQHLQENDHHILGLLSGESSDLFQRYFKDSLKELIRKKYFDQLRTNDSGVPIDFLINHISGSFVEMVLWWLKGNKKQSPEQLDQYFRTVIEPIAPIKTPIPIPMGAEKS